MSVDMRRGLPQRDKLLYASGSLAGNVLFQASAAWLLFFWAREQDGDATRYIPIGIAGLLLGLGRFIDSLNDPIIGYWSDNLRSPLGRRVPFVLFGAPVLALAFFLLWTPPASGVSGWNVVYFFLVIQLFFVFYTIVRGPYAALLPEIATTSAERVSVSAWQVLFGSGGALIGLVVSGVLIEVFGFRTMGLVLGIISLTSHWVAMIGVRKHTRPLSTAPPLGLVIAVRATLANGQFRVYVAAFVAFAFAQSTLTATIPFLVDVLLAGDRVQIGVGGIEATLGSAGATSLVLGGFIGVVMLSLPGLQVASRRFGKGAVFRGCLLATALYLPFIFFVGFLPGLPSFPQIFLLLPLGLPMAGVFVLPDALLGDVIDYDELRTGQRREAMYFGVQGTLQRWAFSLAAIAIGGLLGLFGGTAEDPWGVRLVGPAAGLVVLAGYLAFRRWYRLPDQVSRETVLSPLP
jgi:glycoside/pentoside/hexuronide:cation symporter, GPH family